MGLKIERNKSGKITSLSTGLDVVSWTAFNSLGVRSGVISDEKNKYTHWIPLWINYSHGTRALPLFRQVVSFIFTGRVSSFKGEMGFEIVQKLMNHFVVQMMKGDVFASERALEGYCYFHRWLLVLAELYPGRGRKKKKR